MDEKEDWSFKRAIRNTFTWDKDDWNYIKTHLVWLLIILLLSYLYWSEVRITRQAIADPQKFCVDHKMYNINENQTYPSLNLSLVPIPNG